MIIFGKCTVIIGKSRQSSEIQPMKNHLMKTVTYCQQENLKQNLKSFLPGHISATKRISFTLDEKCNFPGKLLLYLSIMI